MNKTTLEFLKRAEIYVLAGFDFMSACKKVIEDDRKLVKFLTNESPEASAFTKSMCADVYYEVKKQDAVSLAFTETTALNEELRNKLLFGEIK